MNNLTRIRQVFHVLNKNGLSGILGKYGFARYVPFFKRGDATLPSDFPERIRKSMEELGGAYVKLGQLLSLRPDLIPQEYCEEFTKLQDQIPPETAEAIQEEISKEFGKPIKDLFTYFDPRPLGSASVAQVHKARLKTGTAVAVKVQKPNVQEAFKADIEILRYITQKLQNRTKELNAALILNEFERYTKKELDFNIEASHIDAIRAATTRAAIPKVYWTHTSTKVLTMDYLDGAKITDIPEKDKPKTARRLIDALLEQVFNAGVFHADLHPGNILLMPNGKIGLLDFGIVGNLDRKTRNLGVKLYTSILERDPQQITKTLVQYGTPSSKTNLAALSRAVQDQLATWWENRPEKRRVTRLMHNLFILCGKHNISLPKDVILLGKALVTAESTAKKLDQNFNFVEYSQSKIEELLKQQKTPASTIKKFSQRSKTFAQAISELPTKTVETLEAFQQGRIDVHLDDTHFRHFGKDMNLSSNRLSYALIAAALIVASSVMIEIGPKIGTYSIISIVSLTIATLFIILLFLSVFREHHPRHDPHG